MFSVNRNSPQKHATTLRQNSYCVYRVLNHPKLKTNRLTHDSLCRPRTLNVSRSSLRKYYIEPPPPPSFPNIQRKRPQRNKSVQPAIIHQVSPFRCILLLLSNVRTFWSQSSFLLSDLVHLKLRSEPEWPSLEPQESQPYCLIISPYSYWLLL